MKVRKIFIISIIINILTIGIIYNFIKKDYLNNEKIIVKAMTEGEYEEYITSLNQSHINYANYIEESKTKIASAITDMGVTTSNEATPETMANNIKSIARDAISISYNNENSGLIATNVQGAVDEVESEINALNNRLDNKINVTTGAITATSIFTKGNGVANVCCKSGEVKNLYLAGTVTISQPTTYTHIATLPEGFRPKYNVLKPIFSSISNATENVRCYLQINNSGKISLYFVTAGTYPIYINETFI